MTQIPVVWLWISGAFFLVNIIVWVVMIAVLLKLRQVLEETRPKIAELAAKGQQVAQRVEEVAKRVEEVADSVKDTVENVGGRAKGVVGSAELVAQSASKQFERFSPFVVGAITAMRLIKALNEMRRGRSAANATPKGVLSRIPLRRTKKKASLLDFVLGK